MYVSLREVLWLLILIKLCIKNLLLFSEFVSFHWYFFNLNITCSNTFSTIQQLILIQLDFSSLCPNNLLRKNSLASLSSDSRVMKSVSPGSMDAVYSGSRPSRAHFQMWQPPEPSRCRWPLNWRNSASLQESLQPLTQPWRGCGWWSFLLLVARCSDGLSIRAVATDRNSDFRNWYFIHLVDTLTTQVNN